MLEIERKFLIDVIPNDFTYFKAVKITQYYVPKSNIFIRFRKSEILEFFDTNIDLNNIIEKDFSVYTTKYEQIIKSDGSKIRSEFTTAIDENLFEFINTNSVDGKYYKIEKYRFYFYDENHIECTLDLYVDKNIKKIEVEFDSEFDCDNYTIPNWFGLEVTEDKKYSDYNIAIK